MVIARVEDRKGKVLAEFAAVRETDEAMPRATALELVNVMRGVVDEVLHLRRIALAVEEHPRFLLETGVAVLRCDDSAPRFSDLVRVERDKDL